MRRQSSKKNTRPFEKGAVPDEVLTFDDWIEFVQYCADSATADDSSKETANKRASSWAGGTLDSACKLARFGWPKGTELMREMTEELDGLVGSKIERLQIIHDYTGEDVDIGRYAIGEPECMSSWDAVLGEGKGPKFLKIVINITCSCDRDAETMRTRGAAVFALIDMLESTGHRIELWITEPLDCWECNVKLKGYDEPLDPDLAGYALVHESVLRRLFFAANDRESPGMRRAIGSGRGGRDSSYWRSSAAKSQQISDIEIPSLENWAGGSDIKTAQKWVLEKLQEHGVTIIE